MKVVADFFAVGDPRIEWGGETLHARVLRRRVAGAAGWLEEQGLAVGDRVALHLPHGPEAPVLLLACWAAGLVAVPLDLHHPPDRLRALVERSGARLFVTAGRRGAALAARVGGPSLVLDADWPLPEAEASPRLTPDPEDPALILWTSGSTGAPKGVTIPRRAVDAFVAFWRERLAIGPSDRLAWTAALSFDLSLLDIGVALTAGATLLPVPERDLAFPDRLGGWLDARGVTCIYAVPSLLDRALRSPLPRSLRVVLSAGEPLALTLARRLRAALPRDGVLGNLFGPTETNVSTAWLAPVGWDDESVPIGTPCPYVRVRLVDDEILVAGSTVMTGYWGEPDRARWQDRDGERWLHTGDRARWVGDELHFLGRVDRMVKVRGYRVEPEEVEAALRVLPGVDDAAVLAQEVDGETVLVAWFEGTADAESLRATLARRLPSWAVPARMRALARLPRTPRGKVDRAALERSSEVSP